jgi:hypothetical protein
VWWAAKHAPASSILATLHLLVLVPELELVQRTQAQCTFHIKTGGILT